MYFYDFFGRWNHLAQVLDINASTGLETKVDEKMEITSGDSHRDTYAIYSFFVSEIF